MYIIDKYFGSTGLPEAPVLETPQTGCVHPQYDGYFYSPAEYLSWYEKNGPIKTRNSPVVGMMVYRKHIITGAGYVNQLITLIEEEGLKPVPIFINGVEAHTIVRDQMTTEWEQRIVAQGKGDNPTLRKDAIKVWENLTVCLRNHVASAAVHLFIPNSASQVLQYFEACFAVMYFCWLSVATAKDTHTYDYALYEKYHSRIVEVTCCEFVLCPGRCHNQHNWFSACWWTCRQCGSW